MPKRTQSYSAWQLEKLSDPDLATGYLNSVLEDSPEMFLIALRKVAQARQMTKVAKEANVQRETLYHALSEEGNPTWQTLTSVLSAVDLGVIIVNKKVMAKLSPAMKVDLAQSSSTNPPSNWHVVDSTHQVTIDWPPVPTNVVLPTIPPERTQTNQFPKKTIGVNYGTA